MAFWCCVGRLQPTLDGVVLPAITRVVCTAGLDSQTSGAMNETDGASPPPQHSLGPRVSMSNHPPSPNQQHYQSCCICCLSLMCVWYPHKATNTCSLYPKPVSTNCPCDLMAEAPMKGNEILRQLYALSSRTDRRLIWYSQLTYVGCDAQAVPSPSTSHRTGAARMRALWCHPLSRLMTETGEAATDQPWSLWDSLRKNGLCLSLWERESKHQGHSSWPLYQIKRSFVSAMKRQAFPSNSNLWHYLPSFDTTLIHRGFRVFLPLKFSASIPELRLACTCLAWGYISLICILQSWHRLSALKCIASRLMPHAGLPSVVRPDLHSLETHRSGDPRTLEAFQSILLPVQPHSPNPATQSHPPPHLLAAPASSPRTAQKAWTPRWASPGQPEQPWHCTLNLQQLNQLTINTSLSVMRRLRIASQQLQS